MNQIKPRESLLNL